MPAAATAQIDRLLPANSCNFAGEWSSRNIFMEPVSAAAAAAQSSLVLLEVITRVQEGGEQRRRPVSRAAGCRLGRTCQLDCTRRVMVSRTGYTVTRT